VLLAVISYPVGLALGVPGLLPVLNAAPAYAAMVILLRRGEVRRAVVVMLVWAAALAVAGTLTFAVWPQPAGALILHGPEYREEMFAWIRTGAGTEGSPRAFIPQHALHLGAFVVLSLLTASALSITMGAALMNYMDFYVASLARAGAPTWAVVFFGWQPWAMARVAAFSTLGVVLAQPLLKRIAPGGASPRTSRPFVIAAAGLLLLDVLLKTLLAPTWGRILRGVLPD
ncbi:MAG TPA: hypothetical protein VFK70_15655, partial [Vicinamibacteria bacterium]|nr:hypothetical protein [Vicinamibacteria bacterium]